jgi:hypothetical protein
MTAASEQEMSHADRHDLDKLARWKAGLDSAADEGVLLTLPVCAIFLVSPEDRASHDIFRRYRSAFEDLGGGFHHLVIFGQHGVSTTQVAFLAEVGVAQDKVPLLAIASMAKGTHSVHSIELPKGERDGELDDTQTWGVALEALRTAFSGQTDPALGEIDGVGKGVFPRGSLAETVNGVLSGLCAET